MLKRSAVLGILLLLLALGLQTALGAPTPQEDEERPEYIPGQLIISFKAGVTLEQIVEFYAAYNLTEKEDLGDEPSDEDPIMKLASIPGELNQELLETLQRDPRVRYAEPNYVFEVAGEPNDPDFDQLWGLNNSGQTGGTAGADISAVDAWDVHNGSGQVIVGVIDTGVDYTHEDLIDNMWTNPKECPQGPGECEPNGQDDDGNGYVDDFYGVNTTTGSGDPMDDYGHGTHVAGTIGATGNNNTGIAGVNWKVKIAACKFLSASGSGTTADAIKCFNYFQQLVEEQDQKILVTNNSWGGGGFSQALYDAMAAMDGTIHACAAGNSNSSQPHYPAGYELDNIISVAATDHNDLYASFSNYGAPHVDLAAPGVNILSTVPNGSCPLCDPSGYTAANGTSMATPHVAGAAALLWSEYTSMDRAQVTQRLLTGIDPLSDESKETATNGRLNLLNAMEDDETPPAAVTDLAASDATLTDIKLTWTASGDDGFEGTANQYDIRYATTPISEQNWESATQVEGEPEPEPAGSTENFVVTGLDSNTTYYFAMKVYDNVGNASDLSNVATAGTSQGKVVFEDDMEGGPGQWVVEGVDALWHLSTHRYHSPNTSWYYGIEDAWDYDTGTANNGTLTSPAIEIGSVDDALLVFWEWSELESSPTYDRTRVQVSSDGESWQVVFESHGTDEVWQKRTVSLAPYLENSGTIYVRFWFDTTDVRFNDFEGWYIDDVQVLVAVPSDDAEAPAQPNLVMHQANIGFAPAIPIVGDEMTLHAVVFNHGNAEATDVSVQFIDITDVADGRPPVPIGEPQILAYVPAGGSGTVHMPYNTANKEGERTIQVVVDPRNFIAETSEADNEASHTLTVGTPSAANLVVSLENIGFSPDPYVPGDPVTIYATVLNRGDVVAEDVSVQFMDVTDIGSRVPIGEPQVIQSIQPGGSASAQITYETSGLVADRQIEVIADPNNFIRESMETDNSARATLDRAEAGAPNLVVTTGNVGFQLPAGRTTAIEGDEVTIVATILNRSDVTVEGVLVQFTDATDSTATVPISQQQHIENIPPGGSSAVHVVYATAGKAGDRKIDVVVDPHNFIPESRETDNKATVTLKVATLPIPNLVMQAGNIGFNPPSPTEGEEVTVTATVLNNGVVAAEDVEIQFMDVSGNVPVPVGEPQTIASLAPGGSASAQIRYATGDKLGSRNIQVVVDPHNFVAESNEDDNQASRSFSVGSTPLPNLVMLATNVEFGLAEGRTTPVEGDPITITAVVLNTGSVEARRVLVQFIDVTNAGATPIGAEQIIDVVPVGSSATAQVVYDTTGLTGERKIQVLVDSNNLIPESNDRDNEARVGLSLEPAPTPNLVILASNIGLNPPEPSAGENIQIAVTVLNDGTVDAENVAIQFMDFTHGETTPIGVVQNIESIPAGGSATAGVTHRLPDEPGERRLRVVVDPDNAVAESDESDNRATVPVVVAPAPTANLRMMESNIGFSTPTPTAGTAVSVTATVLNVGDVAAHEVLVQFVDVSGGGAEPIGAKQTISTIEAGSSGQVSVVYDTANKTGERRIRVLVDPHTTIPENDETDNQATKTLSVATAPVPNLVVPEANLNFDRTSPVVGDIVIVNATVLNNGSAPARSVLVQFVDVTNDGQSPIGSHQIIDFIGVGGSGTAQISYDTAGKIGDRQIQVLVDPNNLIAETNDGDNERTKTLSVVPAPAPNLVMQTDNVGFSPSTPNPGDPVTLLATVRNDGSVEATEVMVQFIDSTETSLATPIGETQVIDSIPPGGSALTQVLYSPPGGGDRKIDVVVDPSNTIAETSESDNTAKTTLQLATASTPNLVVDEDNIGFSRADPLDGDQVAIHAVIRNEGSAQASNVAIHFADVTESSAPRPLGQQQIIDNIPPGGSGTASTLYDTSGRTGERSIEVIADPNNFIFESRESDNEATVTLAVTDTIQPNLVMLAPNIGFNPATPVIGQTVIVHAVVLNRGVAPVSDVNVYLMDVTNGSPIPVDQPKVIPTIPTGASGAVQFSYDTAGKLGDRLLRVVADPSNFIAETDEDDNTATKPLSVVARPAPNLVMLSSGIAFDPPNPGDGNLVSIRATVLNNGTANASDVVVHFLDVTGGDQTPIGKPRLIDTIPAGASDMAEVIYDTTDKAGERTIRVVVDPNDTVEESQETDNTSMATLTVAAPPAPNLVARAENITFSPSSPSAGNPVTITVTVPNEGELDASNVLVQFMDVTNGGSTPIGDKQTIDLILADGSGKASVVYDTEGKTGERTIQVVVDPDELIPETDEDDNQASTTLTVDPPSEEPSEEPNLTISASGITFDPSNPGIGMTVTITATVRNTGDADTSNVAVQFLDATDDGEPTPISETQTITSVVAGGSGTASVVYETGEEEGERTIRVVVDPDDSIPESNETDNEAEKTLIVGTEENGEEDGEDGEEENGEEDGEENGEEDGEEDGEEETTVRPNLVVTTDQIALEEGDGEGELTIAVTILNNGAAPAEGVVVRVADVTDGEAAVADERTITAILPSSAETARLAYIPAGQPGDRTLEVTVDPDGDIEEMDEDDNRATRDVATN